MLGPGRAGSTQQPTDRRYSSRTASHNYIGHNCIEPWIEGTVRALANHHAMQRAMQQGYSMQCNVQCNMQCNMQCNNTMQHAMQH